MNLSARLALFAALFTTVASGVILTFQPVHSADSAPTPYETCREAGVAPHGETARDCRERGWVVTATTTIDPRGRVVTGLPACRTEDSRRCYWNARVQGNGEGRSFVQIGSKGTFYAITRINGVRAGTRVLAPSTVPVGRCSYTAEITAYAQVGNYWDDVVPEVDWSNTIREHKCRVTDADGNLIRYMRADANTAGEYTELMNLAHFKRKYPIILCGNEIEAHLIDLSYYYFHNVKKISAAEHRGYRPWAKAYAEQHDCRVYAKGARS